MAAAAMAAAAAAAALESALAARRAVHQRRTQAPSPRLAAPGPVVTGEARAALSLVGAATLGPPPRAAAADHGDGDGDGGGDGSGGGGGGRATAADSLETQPFSVTASQAAARSAGQPHSGAARRW